MLALAVNTFFGRRAWVCVCRSKASRDEVLDVPAMCEYVRHWALSDGQEGAGKKMATFWFWRSDCADANRTRTLVFAQCLSGPVCIFQLSQGVQQGFCLWFPALFQSANADIGNKDAGFAVFGQIAEAMPHYGILGSHSSCSIQVSEPSLHQFYAIQAEKMRV